MRMKRSSAQMHVSKQHHLLRNCHIPKLQVHIGASLPMLALDGQVLTIPAPVDCGGPKVSTGRERNKRSSIYRGIDLDCCNSLTNGKMFKGWIEAPCSDDGIEWQLPLKSQVW